MIKRFFILLFFLLVCRPASAAFAFDTSAQSTRSTANPKTLAYTCGADAKLLVVMIAINSNAGRTAGDVTYDGVPMIQVGPRVSAGVEVTSEMWYLTQPSAGVAATISVPNASGVNIRIMAVSFSSDANAVGGGLESFTSSNVSVANPSLTITPATNGTAIVNILSDGNTNDQTAHSQTLLFSNDEGAWNDESQYAVQATKAPITFSWTVASDDVTNILAVFKEAFGTEIKGTSHIAGTSEINGQ